MIAANQGHTSIVRLLLSHGADAQVRDPNGQTALTIATRKGYTAIAELLQGGARN